MIMNEKDAEFFDEVLSILITNGTVVMKLTMEENTIKKEILKDD